MADRKSDQSGEVVPQRSHLRWLKAVVVLVAVGLLMGLFVMWAADAHYEARKSQVKNNLKKIGLGAQNFHDTFGHFPPMPSNGSEDKEVTQPVSFHTILIPFIEANSYFEKIDLTIPNSRLMPDRIGFSLDDISDGAGTTILAGGIDDAAVPAWGDPQNDRDAAEGFGGGPKAFGGLPEEGGSLVVFSDGHVDEFDAETNARIAKALATPAGGDTVTDSNLRP